MAKAPVNTAVILAAGLGSRLKDRTKSIPKGFLELEGVSLIRRSLDQLFAAGIEKVFIGTGYLSEFYQELAERDSRVECIKSDRYESTSSMYTLYNMREKIKTGFLLLESDLLYESRALRELQDDPDGDIILASGMTGSGDEVFIQTDSRSFLQKMSKKREDLQTADAELSGISKLSKERYDLMCRHFEAVMDEMPKVDYEYIFVRTAADKPFRVKRIDDLIWCEIDDESHLDRALTKILPRIKEKENHGDN